MKGVIICTADLIKKNFKHSITLIIQIAVTVIILIGFLGRVQYILSTKNIASTFNNSKAIYYYPFMFLDSEMTAKDIIKENDLDVKMVGEADYMLITCNDQLRPVVGYNDTLLECVDLKLSSGKWFDEQVDKNTIPLISTNQNYSLNDSVTFKDRAGKEHKAVVIGTIDPDEYVLSFNQSGSKSVISIDLFVSKPYADFIAPYDSEKFSSLSKDFDMFLEMGMPKTSLGKVIFYDKADDIEAIEKVFSKYGTTADIDLMIKNYKKDIRFNLLINGIVLAVFIILTATGIGGINGLQSRLDRRNYIIYYMLGMNSKKCALTELLRSFAIVTIGFMLALLLYSTSFVRENIFFSEIVTVPWHFLFAFVLIILICCIVSLKYVIDLGRGSLIERYKNQD